MRADLRIRLADGTQVGYAEVGAADGHPVLHLHGTPGSRLEVGIPAARRAAEQDEAGEDSDEDEEDEGDEDGEEEG